MLYDLTVGDWG